MGLRWDASNPSQAFTKLAFTPQQLTRIALALKTGAFLVVALQLLSPYALTLALALLAPGFLLGATWFAGLAAATALLALVSAYESRVIPLNN